MRRALIAAAVTSGVVAARRRTKHQPVAVPAAVAPAVPAQRAKLVEGDAELCVADQEAEDNHLLDLLDRL